MPAAVVHSSTARFAHARNRNGADVLSFANQVSNHAVLLADLEIFRSESNQFSPSQSASDEQRQNRPITFASETGGRWFTEQGFGLINGQPVPNPYAETLCAFDATDSCRQIRTQKAAYRRLHRRVVSRRLSGH